MSHFVSWGSEESILEGFVTKIFGEDFWKFLFPCLLLYKITKIGTYHAQQSALCSFHPSSIPNTPQYILLLIATITLQSTLFFQCGISSAMSVIKNTLSIKRSKVYKYYTLTLVYRSWQKIMSLKGFGCRPGNFQFTGSILTNDTLTDREGYGHQSEQGFTLIHSVI